MKTKRNILNIIIVLTALLFSLIYFGGCKNKFSQNEGTHNNMHQNNKQGFINMVAATPPMGWNNWDSYGRNINETKFLAQARFMKNHLSDYGYRYAIIDGGWSFLHLPGRKQNERRPQHFKNRLTDNWKPLDTLSMDKWGRLFPAINRFPSAKDGRGFKLVADSVHDLGLEFGIHIMRGIPRQAFWENTPIKGTSYTARDIADTASSDLSKWNRQMYGVDPDKPGAQAYYNSVFDLYAQWGVDFIKIDDISHPYHKGEIEMVRKAIDQSGRPMVLSLSSGPTPVSEAGNVSKNANMWRISTDFWDNWKQLKHHFELFNAWSKYIGPNHWPDGGMLPMGHLSLYNRPKGHERMSKFTKNEEYTLLTLWVMARSPLIMSGDLSTTPDSTISLLQNKEVIAVDQYSTDNHQLYRNRNEVVWMAKDMLTGIKYLALFNLDDKPQIIDFNFDSIPGTYKGPYKIRDLWKKKDIGILSNHIRVQIGPHGADLFNLIEAGPASVK